MPNLYSVYENALNTLVELVQGLNCTLTLEQDTIVQAIATKAKETAVRDYAEDNLSEAEMWYLGSYFDFLFDCRHVYAEDGKIEVRYFEYD